MENLELKKNNPPPQKTNLNMKRGLFVYGGNQQEVRGVKEKPIFKKVARKIF
jgi:hypothetical protein